MHELQFGVRFFVTSSVEAECCPSCLWFVAVLVGAGPRQVPAPAASEEEGQFGGMLGMTCILWQMAAGCCTNSTPLLVLSLHSAHSLAPPTGLQAGERAAAAAGVP